MEQFRGFMAGIGTASGTRLVIGHWESSPFGAFTDVMVQEANGLRTLLAPTRETAHYVSSTYRSDHVLAVPLDAELAPTGLSVSGGPLDLRAGLGRVTPLGRLLERVPPPLAVSPRWLRLISPLSSLVVPGVRTAGSAGGGRREYYGVRSIRSIEWVDATWEGRNLGQLHPISPPVEFGFSSVPSTPQIMAVTTTITGP